LSGFVTHTAPPATRTPAAFAMTGIRAVTRSERGSTRATRHAPQSRPSTTSQTEPAPVAISASPPSSRGTRSATWPLTRLRAGSMRASPGAPHVAVQTAPSPTAVPSHGRWRTRTVAIRSPVAASSR
jgi:hypothetical protein